MTDLPLIIDDRETPRFWVNRAAMVEEDIRAREVESIFDKCWLYVGHDSELAENHDFRTRKVGGRPVIFTRGTDGEVRVLLNTCTHRGMEIETRGSGNGRFLKCFYHGWSFDTTGELVAMPLDTDYPDGWSRADRCLPRPAFVDNYRGFWFLCWDKEQSQTLKEYLSNATDFLDLVSDQSLSDMTVTAGTHLYSMKANWKLLVENSIDGYHALTTHHRYLEMIKASGADFGERMSSEGGGGALDLGNGHSVVGSADVSKGMSRGMLGREFPDDETRELYKRRRDSFVEKYGEEWTDRIFGGRNLSIFPNLIIVDQPMGCTIRTFFPDEPGYMDITGWEIQPVDEPQSLHEMRQDDFLTFWGPAGLATPDDVEALERCQRGFAGYKTDPWNDISRGMGKEEPGAMDELQMRVFWRRYNELMTGDKSEPEASVYVTVGRGNS